MLAQAWSEPAGAYAGAFGSDDLHVSVLLMPLVGFLPADDSRMLATIEAVRDRLTDGRLVRRWAGDTAGFVICSFWLVECLARPGRVEEADDWSPISWPGATTWVSSPSRSTRPARSSWGTSRRPSPTSPWSTPHGGGRTAPPGRTSTTCNDAPRDTATGAGPLAPRTKETV